MTAPARPSTTASSARGQAGPSCTDAPITVSILDYFMAGYVPGKASGFRLGGGQTLPIAVALGILLVVLAGIPLAVVRRRSGQRGRSRMSSEMEQNDWPVPNE